MQPSADFVKQIQGFGLTTAKIWYTHPDAPDIINPNWFTWQEYDICPRFPRLFEYLNWWQKTLDGKPIIVKVAHGKLIKPAEISIVGKEFKLH